MSTLLSIIFLFLFHALLLVPGYGFIRKLQLTRQKNWVELCLAYTLSIVVFALVAVLRYALALPHWAAMLLVAGYVVGGTVLFVVNRELKALNNYRFPLLATFLLGVFSLLFIGLSLRPPYSVIPDPQPIAGYTYTHFDVKVLNVAQTPANDNSIPYRQAQFMVNRSDPAKDSFIDEWGVGFFQRTPLMGAVTAGYFLLTHQALPIGYIWASDSTDPTHTYRQFQVIGAALNSILMIPAFFLLKKLFSEKTAQISLLFFIPSHFFLANSFFTWPKSFTAFFILFSWLLLIENGTKRLVMAAIVSGLAYLSHDLAILYITASFIYLLYKRRFAHSLIFTTIIGIIAAPWLLLASLKYHKPSTFIYYPISMHDIPQYDDRHKLIEEFKHTSIFRLIQIRLDSLFYLLSPYQLIYSEAAQSIVRRIWALSIFSFPGSVGLGLAIPAYIAVLRQKLSFYIFTIIPILACVVVIGWPKGLGASHFAEAIVILFAGAAIHGMLTKKWYKLVQITYWINILQLVLYVLFSYNFVWREWLVSFQDWLLILAMASVAVYGWLQIRKLLPPLLSEK